MENDFADRPLDSGDPIARLRDRLLVDSRDVWAIRDLAALLGAANDIPGAIDLHQRALRIDPYATESLVDLGRLWNRLGEIERARSWFARALAIDPDCADASTGLAELSDPGALTAAYVRTLFDQYADKFDENLTGILGYRAPQDVAAMLLRLGVPLGSMEILDLGCGTGLSGLALRPFAARLDGMDLSSGMIAKARERGLYDRLIVEEAQAYLDRGNDSWDMIAAIDVLNYIGELTPILGSAASRLRPAGWLVGSVEKRDEGGTVLTAKRRHTHGADHLRQAIEAAGLTLVELMDVTIRQEGGQPVPGLIFAARRSS